MPVLKNAEYGWHNGRTPGKNICFNTLVPDKTASIISMAVKRYLKTDQEIQSILCLFSEETLAGSYCVTTTQTQLFVRISSRTGNLELESSLLDYLSQKGVSVNPIYFSIIIKEESEREYRLDIRPFIEGRHFTGAMDELNSLLVNLEHLHSVLKIFPEKNSIKAKAAVRYSVLAKIGEHVRKAVSTNQFNVFNEARPWAENNRAWLEKMAGNFAPEFHLAPDAQPLHGEIHSGNVIFDDLLPIFIDFEESIHIYASPTWDLAYVIQRFCFWGNPTIEQLTERCRLVRFKFEPDLQSLTYMMRQVAWFSIAVLLDIRLNQGVVSPISEYEKFVELEAQAHILEFLK